MASTSNRRSATGDIARSTALTIAGAGRTRGRSKSSSRLATSARPTRYAIHSRVHGGLSARSGTTAALNNGCTDTERRGNNVASTVDATVHRSPERTDCAHSRLTRRRTGDTARRYADGTTRTSTTVSRLGVDSSTLTAGNPVHSRHAERVSRTRGSSPGLARLAVSDGSAASAMRAGIVSGMESEGTGERRRGPLRHRLAHARNSSHARLGAAAGLSLAASAIHARATSVNPSQVHVGVATGASIAVSSARGGGRARNMEQGQAGDNGRITALGWSPLLAPRGLTASTGSSSAGTVAALPRNLEEACHLVLHAVKSTLDLQLEYQTIRPCPQLCLQVATIPCLYGAWPRSRPQPSALKTPRQGTSSTPCSPPRLLTAIEGSTGCLHGESGYSSAAGSARHAAGSRLPPWTVALPA